MTTGYLADARRGAFRVVALQLLVTLLAAAVAALAGGWNAAWAALLGGAIGTAANLAMTWRVWGGEAQRDPKRFLVRLMLGQTAKFVITVLLFVAAIVMFRAAFLPLILAYMATFLAQWIELARGSFGKAT